MGDVEKSLIPALPPSFSRTVGTKGRKILVETNHLPLDISKLKEAFHYDVTLDPDKPIYLIRPAMEMFRQKYYPQRFPAFDGKKNLFSSSLLPFGESTSGEVEVKGEREKPVKFKISIKLANRIDMTMINTYLNTNDPNVIKTINVQLALLCIDIVLRQSVGQKFIPVGRNYFSSPTNEVLLGDGMSLYKGFYLSAILGWKPFLNVDVAHKAFPQHGSVLKILEQFKDRRGNTNFPDFERHMKNVKVEYIIPGKLI